MHAYESPFSRNHDARFISASPSNRSLGFLLHFVSPLTLALLLCSASRFALPPPVPAHNWAARCVRFGCTMRSLSRRDCAFAVTNNQCAQVRVLGGHRGEVSTVCVTPNGKHVVTGSNDKTARVWRIDDGAHVRTLKEKQRRLSASAFGRGSVRVKMGTKWGDW
eukprot:6176391-Pleurochrysis_carterae.AAC.1